MKVEYLFVGALQEIAYFLIDEETNKTFIVDPGAEADRILEKIKKQNLQVEALLITHGHYDHIGAVMALKEALGCKVIAHEHAKLYLQDTNYNLSTAFGGAELKVEADEYVQEGDTLTLEGTDLTLEVLYAPGHTLDSAVYYTKAYQAAFVGDVIFKDSIGRTDLQGGSYEQLQNSIREKIYTLEDETILYPGHGPFTSVGYEKNFNPYVSKA
jgi:glyoxylase-like metal-dependent hydrolase (beta-lactamase superfamily II)